jgi:hypothetical protein
MLTLSEKSGRVFYFCKMRPIHYFIFTVLLIGSCTSQEKNDQQKPLPADKKPTEWEVFLKEIPDLNFPLQFKTHQGIPIDGLIKMNSKQADLFFEGETNYFLYGKLNFPSNIKAIIVLYPADVVVPRIYTFTEEGEFISKEDLFLNGNTMDCGFRYFS